MLTNVSKSYTYFRVLVQIMSGTNKQKDKQFSKTFPLLGTMGEKNMRIGAFNCQGLKEKIDYPDFLKLASNMDLFGVSETWLRDNDIIYLPGFKFYPQNRKNCKGRLGEGLAYLSKMI